MQIPIFSKTFNRRPGLIRTDHHFNRLKIKTNKNLLKHSQEYRRILIYVMFQKRKLIIYDYILVIHHRDTNFYLFLLN